MKKKGVVGMSDIKHTQPLAVRMRPRNLSEVMGQQHLIGENKILTRMAESRRLYPMVLYGVPGIGKTSIAHALASELGMVFEYFNASNGTKRQLEAATKKGAVELPVVLLIDEIHRLNKPNQDFLLMKLEEGSVIMIGATTENPYISINPAIRSRGHILELKPITPEDIVERLKFTLQDRERGFGNVDVEILDNDLRFIADQTNGDLRAALNTLDLVVSSTKENEAGTRVIDRESIITCIPNRQIGGDKDGDTHYNLLSAFQKSIRGSDADASLHYLARLIESGDLISIIRRLLVITYEDIGLANPELTAEVYAAISTVERVGLPEARIPLSYITIRLALSPKSNVAYRAIDGATAELQSNKSLDIPNHLKDAHYKGAARLGHGIGYKYAHDCPHSIATAQYLPNDYQNDRYLQFRDRNDTPEVAERYHQINEMIKPGGVEDTWH